MLRFYVKDTGPGIPEEKQELIFEKFRQIDDSYLREEEGSGLGLPISKAFIKKLGGEIWIESKVGDGTKFTFTIPYIPIVKTKKAEPITEKIPFTGISTILVAEDDPINLLYIKEILAEENVQLICTSNGKEAIELVAKNPNISLALMDLKMPITKGIDATREILKTNPELPIIAQTAYASNNNREKAIKAGCVDYIIPDLSLGYKIKIIYH